MTGRPVGWRKQPARHALAAKGIKTIARSGQSISPMTSPTITVAVYDFKTGTTRTVSARADNVIRLTMLIEYEEQPSGYWLRHREQDVFVLSDDYRNEDAEQWLDEQINHDREEIFHDNAEMRFIVRGRITAARVDQDTGIPFSRIVATVDTVAGE